MSRSEKEAVVPHGDKIVTGHNDVIHENDVQRLQSVAEHPGGFKVGAGVQIFFRLQFEKSLILSDYSLTFCR